MRIIHVNTLSKLAIALMGIGLMISGCNKPDTTDAQNKQAAQEAAPTQVAATVNGKEITVHQVERLLAPISPETDPAVFQDMKNRVLDDLILQRLMVDDAIREKLDRTPKVLDQLQQAKDMVLLRAYQEYLLGKMNRPTETELRTAYDEKAAEYADNVRYQIRRVSVMALPAELGPLAKRAENADNIDAFIHSVKNNPNVRTNEQNMSIDSAMIPDPLAADLAEAKVGAVKLLRGPNGFALEEIIKVEKAPIGYDVAKRQLERQLFMRRQQETMDNQLKHLRKSAKITYMNGFSEMPVEDKPAKADQQNPAASEANENALTNAQPDSVSKTPAVKTDETASVNESAAETAEPAQSQHTSAVQNPAEAKSAVADGVQPAPDSKH